MFYINERWCVKTKNKLIPLEELACFYIIQKRCNEQELNRF